MFNLNQPGGLRRAERSQSMVEFALSLVALIMLISGVLDLGRLYFIYAAMKDTVGEGAIFMSVFPDCMTSTQCADPNNVIYRMRNSGSGLLNFTDWHVVNTLAYNSTPSYVQFRVCWPDDPDNTADPAQPWATSAAACAVTGPAYDVNTQDAVWVEMRYQYQLLTPIIPQIAGVNPLSLTVGDEQYLVLK